MEKMYTVDNSLLADKPEIRIFDKIFTVDDRMTTFEKMNKALAQADSEVSEFDIVIEHGLSAEGLKEIKSMDLSFAAMRKTVMLIMAAMQGITEDEAERRFQSVNG